MLSKACQLIPLRKLPAAFETTEHLCNYMFRFYGLLENIVSDRGSQFISLVWATFFQQLNINVSLTSGYYPQSNVQNELRNHTFPQNILKYWSIRLELLSTLGWMPPKLSLQTLKRLNPFLKCAFLPTSLIPLVRRTHRPPRSQWMVTKCCRQIMPVSYHLATFHVSLLKPAGGPRGEEDGDQGPPPIIVDSKEACQVQDLLDSRRQGIILQYLVDWECMAGEVVLGQFRRHSRHLIHCRAPQDLSR